MIQSRPTGPTAPRRPRSVALVAVLALAGVAAATPALATPAATATADEPCTTTYYVALDGDGTDGLTEATAFPNPWDVYGLLEAGTCVLLKGGQTFEGGFYLDDTQAGDPAAPVVIGSFGEGRATLDAGTGDGIFVHNTAGVTVRDLVVVGDGYDPGPPASGNFGTGIFLYADQGGASKHRGVTVTDVDVSGFVNGVLVGGQHRSGFADVLFERVATHDNADAGFQTYGDAVITSTDYAHHDVVVRSMASFRNRGMPGKGTNSGNGIIFGDVDGGLIEHSHAYENGDLNDHPGGGPIGIWAYDSNDVTIQFNVAHHNASGTVDGGGFDLDGGVTNSVMQYNYSHNNAGAGYLVFQYEGARPLENNVVRYNISHNDGRKGQYGAITVGSYGTPATDTWVYGNSVYIEPNAGGHPAGIRVWDGSEGAYFFNNSVHVAGGVPLVSVEQHTTSTFQGNNYHSSGEDFRVLVGGTGFDDSGAAVFGSLAGWRAATGAETLAGNPVGLQAEPGYEGDPATGSGDAEVFRIGAGSALNGTGLDLAGLGVADDGGRDFFGEVVPRDGRYSVGASQGPAPLVPPGGPAFADVPAGHPFHDEIRWAADAGLATGTPIGDQVYFFPSSATSRQAMAAFLHRHAGDGWEPAAGTRTFSDVGPDHPFHTEIEWMAAEGLTAGYGDGTFGPGRPVSRQAVAAFLHRLAGEPEAAAPGFPDVPADHELAAPIAWAQEAGIVTGYADGSFRPAAAVSRQAVAAFLHRFDAG